jgi:hypothetical protein
MKEVLTEWRQFLTEQEDKNRVQSIVGSIFAANGKISLPSEDVKLLQRYVSDSSKTDPLGAAQAAVALSAYFKESGVEFIARHYEDAAKRLRGLSKYSGNKPLTRAIDTFLGADDPVVEKGIYASTYSPEFAKAIISLSTWFKSKTGLNILDPSQAQTVPKWAKDNPKTYAALQTAADIFASDPITAIDTLTGVGAISKAVARRAMGTNLKKLIRKKVGPIDKQIAQNLNDTKQAIIGGDQVLAQKAAKQTKNKIKNRQDQLKKLSSDEILSAIQSDGLFQLALDPGKFTEYMIKHFNVKQLSRSQMKNLESQIEKIRQYYVSAYLRQDFENLQSVVIEFAIDKNNRFYPLFKKYNARIDLLRPDNAYALIPTSNPFVNSQLRLAEKGLQRKIDFVPITGFGKKTLRTGKAQFRTLAHEAGHIEFLKNYPNVGKDFFDEFESVVAAALRRKLNRMKNNPNRVYNQDLMDIFQKIIKLGDEKTMGGAILQLRDLKKQLSPKQFQDHADLALMRDLMNDLDQMKSTISQIKKGKDMPFTFARLNKGKENLRTVLGQQYGGSIYYLDPQEAFAELFEKAARSQGTATSKSFPKTVEKINKIVEKEFLVKESFIRFRIANK